MQSKLVAAKDYHEVALDIPAFVPDQAALQKELDRLRNPYVTWEAGRHGGCRRYGPLFAALCAAALSKRQHPLCAGSGMYNPTLEALAIGMQAGETRTATLPEGEVALTVQAVQKRVVPALTDEMAAACKLPGVRTVAGTGATCWRSSGTKPPRRPPGRWPPGSSGRCWTGPRLCSARRIGSRRWSKNWTAAVPSPGRAAWCWNR